MRHDQPLHITTHYFEGIHAPVHGCFQARELFTNMGAEDQRRVLLAAQFLFGVHGKGVRNHEPSRATPVTPCDNTKRSKKSFALMWLL